MLFAKADKPELVGRYELLGQLKSGGMAELHLARMAGPDAAFGATLGIDTLAVIKRMLPELAQREEFVAMFLDEAQLAASLNHVHIAQTFDVGNHGGRCFLVMEYLHGVDLRDLFRHANREGRAIPLPVVLCVGIAVAEALHYAHELRGADGRPRDIVHRDVSPQNVVLTYQGGIKLVDFGIAQATNRRTETRTGVVKGKIGYMSPEQCRGRAVDRRSDLYSLSVILWELGTGQRLFGTGTDFDLMRRIVDEDAPRPSSRVPGFPVELEKILLKGLSREPSARFATARELLLALEDFARAESLSTSPLTVERFLRELFADRLARFESAREDGTLFDHVLATTSERMLAAPAGRESEIRPRTRQLGPSPRRRRTSLLIGGCVAAMVAASIAMFTRSSRTAVTTATAPRVTAIAAPAPMNAAPAVSPTSAPRATSPTHVVPARGARATAHANNKRGAGALTRTAAKDLDLDDALPPR